MLLFKQQCGLHSQAQEYTRALSQYMHKYNAPKSKTGICFHHSRVLVYRDCNSDLNKCLLDILLLYS